LAGLLSFHAHPDDEVITTGGVLARYARAGEQVVVVTATDGAEGEIHNYDDPDSLKPELAAMRAEEVRASLDLLGVKHHEFLGYRDSGMMGTEANDHPLSFWQADLFEASKRLVRLIRRYQPEVMTVYDPFGSYGHPDHIQVHRVGMAAFFGCRDLGWFPLETGEEFWAPAKLYWNASSRSRNRAMAKYWDEPENPEDDDDRWWENRGIPDEEISAIVDVRAEVELKLAALKAHRTQIPADWFFLRIPPEGRDEALGFESFQRIFSTVVSPMPENDLFAGLR
jgi:N-acetyl-1-D-myo-inositol-2-amino-2-deoxy-alpha-D-glucopyranoside deacetylase